MYVESRCSAINCNNGECYDTDDEIHCICKLNYYGKFCNSRLY